MVQYNQKFHIIIFPALSQLKYYTMNVLCDKRCSLKPKVHIISNIMKTQYFKILQFLRF